MAAGELLVGLQAHSMKQVEKGASSTCWAEQG